MIFPNIVQSERSTKTQQNPLTETNVYKKLEVLLNSCSADLVKLDPHVPSTPGRDVLVLARKDHPPKLGFSKAEGKARMIHDLASIELQAMELGLRTLFEFPDATPEFREQLANITINEAEHFQLCLVELENLGFKWGHWPVHLGLWEATSTEDTLLDRILIVHRYLEGSGLDACDTLLRRLSGLTPELAHKGIENAVRVISTEEIGHVDFGSKYYRFFCKKEKIDPVVDFPLRMERIEKVLPRRLEKINRPLRLKAGFTDLEIDFLERFQTRFIKNN